MSRKARGMRTQRIIAEYLSEVFPHCYPAGAGESGKDLRRTPGYSVEIKARTRLDIPGSLRQAASNAEPGDVPLLVARLNGQGEKNVGNFAVVMTLESLTKLIGEQSERQDQGQHEETGTSHLHPERQPEAGSTHDPSGSRG